LFHPPASNRFGVDSRLRKWIAVCRDTKKSGLKRKASIVSFFIWDKMIGNIADKKTF